MLQKNILWFTYIWHKLWNFEKKVDNFFWPIFSDFCRFFEYLFFWDAHIARACARAHSICYVSIYMIPNLVQKKYRMCTQKAHDFLQNRLKNLNFPLSGHCRKMIYYLRFIDSECLNCFLKQHTISLEIKNAWKDDSSRYFLIWYGSWIHISLIKLSKMKIISRICQRVFILFIRIGNVLQFEWYSRTLFCFTCKNVRKKVRQVFMVLSKIYAQKFWWFRFPKDFLLLFKTWNLTKK